MAAWSNKAAKSAGSKGEKSDDRAAAREAAIRLLARREHSMRELETKLASRGFERDCARAVIAELAADGLQSEQRFAEAWCRQRAGRGYGPLRIRAELAERGVAAEVIDHAFDVNDVDFLEVAADWLLRRYGQPDESLEFKERARRSQALYRRGFEPGMIRSILGNR